MKTDQRFACCAAIALALLCFSANFCNIKHSISKDTTPRGLVAILEFDPYISVTETFSSIAGEIIKKHIYEGLTRVDNKGNIQNALAEKIDVSENGYEYTFHMRPSTWNDGTILTSYDFARSWKNKIKKDTGCTIMDCIKNVSSYKNGLVPIEDIGISTLDPYTLQVTLEKPLPYFLYLTSTSAFSPIHRERAGINTTTNGPFIIDDWQPKIRLLLKKNHFYWDQKNISLPFIEFLFTNDKAVAMSFLQSNSADFAVLKELTTTSGSGQNNTNRIWVMGQTGTTCVLLVNPNHYILKNNKIRQALSQSIIRDDIVQFVSKMGSKAHFLTPPVISKRAYSPVSIEDYTETIQLFEQGIEELGITREEFKNIYITVSREHPPLKIVKAIQEQWGKILNVYPQIKIMDFDSQKTLIKEFSFDIWACLWIAKYPDSMSFLEPFKRDGTIGSKIKLNKVHELINSAEKCENFLDRQHILYKAEQVLLQTYIVLPIYYPGYICGIHRNITGIYLDPLYCTDFSRAYWTK